MTVTAMPQTSAPSTGDAPPAEPAKSRKKLLLIVGVALLGAAAAWWFLLRPTDAGPPPPPEPGEVVAMESIQINLADGRYLRIGIALQFVAETYSTDGSKALDATIDLFSGRDMAQLTSAEDRDALKTELNEQLQELYDGEVIEAYFTDFVTQ